MSEKKLGRGLDFLIGSESPLEGDEILEVEIERIRPNRSQPRTEFNAVALQELAQSIRRHGFLQPLIVRPNGDRYELVAGERRYRAAKLIGLDTVPTVVRDFADDQILEIALIENIQREDLDAIEKAHACRKIMDASSLTQEAVAATLGKDRSTIANLLRLLDLPDEIQELVHRRALSMGHARALLGLSSLERRLEVAEEIVKERLSVRETESLIARESRAREAGSTPSARSRRERPTHIVELEETLERALGSKVRITLQRGRSDRGKLQVEFYSESDFQKLLDRLAPDRDDLP